MTMTDDERWARVCETQAAVRNACYQFIHGTQARAAVLDGDGRLDALEYLRE